MEVGDLIIVTQYWPPDWNWLDYTTGDLGIIVKVKPGYYENLLVIFFFHNETERPVPEKYVKALKERQ